MKNALEFNQVRRGYKPNRPVLTDVTFQISPGEIVGLVGRNGAGKSTLIRLAMGMLHPDAGTIRVLDLSPTHDPVAMKRRIGYVAEDQILPGNVKLESLIALYKTLFAHWDDNLQQQLLDRFALPLNRRIAALSKGQARQAALLLALCHRPEVLILDEPAGGLDPVARREFLETAIQILNREGTAILFSTHYISDLERLGGRLLLLDNGTVRIDSNVDDLKEEVCLAIIPEVTDSEAVSRMHRSPRYLHARHVKGSCRIVLRGSASAVRAEVQDAFRTEAVGVTHLPLEDLFIELVGTSSNCSPGAGR